MRTHFDSYKCFLLGNQSKVAWQEMRWTHVETNKSVKKIHTCIILLAVTQSGIGCDSDIWLRTAEDCNALVWICHIKFSGVHLNYIMLFWLSPFKCIWSISHHSSRLQVAEHFTPLCQQGFLFYSRGTKISWYRNLFFFETIKSTTDEPCMIKRVWPKARGAFKKNMIWIDALSY